MAQKVRAAVLVRAQERNSALQTHDFLVPSRLSSGLGHFIPAVHYVPTALLLTILILSVGGPVAVEVSAKTGSSTALSFQQTCDSATLSNQAKQFRSEWTRVSLEQAIANYNQVRRCSQVSGDTKAEALALKAIGDIYIVLSEFEKARDNYVEALSLRKKDTDGGAESDSLADLAFSLIFLSEKEQAREVATRAVTLAQQVKDPIRTARALSVLSTALYFGGDIRGALDPANESLLLVKETKEHEILGQTLLVLGYVNNDLADLDAALSFYTRALAEWRASGNVWGESKTLASIGLVQTLLGDRDAALEALRATLPILERTGDRMSQGVAFNNIAYVYQTVGELDASLGYYLKALRIYQEIKFKVGEAVTLQYCADIYAFTGNMKSAVEYYDQSMTLSRAIQNTYLQAEGLNGLGSIHFKLGDRQTALDFFQRSLAEFRKANHWRGQSSALNNTGYYYEMTGNNLKARENYREALVFARSAQDHDGAAAILYNLARVEATLGFQDEARAHIEESLKLDEASRAKVASPDLRVSYFASIHEHYEFYIDLLMQLHKSHPRDGFDIKALQASEKARARSLLELLSQTNVDFKKVASPDLLNRERTLRAQLGAEYLKSANDKKQATALQKLEIEYEEVKNLIRIADERYALIALPATVRLDEVQRQLLDADTAILEYSLGEKRSYLWVITRDDMRSYELPARSTIESLAINLINSLKQLVPDASPRNRGTGLTDPDTRYWTHSAKLSALIFADALRGLTATRLIIVGDGALQSVPFAALTKPGSKEEISPRTLLADYELIELPSISVLSVFRGQIAKRDRAPQSVAVFADPVFESNDPRITQSKTRNPRRKDSTPNLAGTDTSANVRRSLRDTSFENGIGRLVFSRQEAQAILSTVPNSLVALDFRANRNTVLSSQLSQFRIIHFATHGVLNTKHPELSGILLSMVDETGRPQDGFVQLGDIYKLNLRAELIVLSACETSLGKAIVGEGRIGLIRGFMYAGAKSVIGSLWKVDDSATAALMGEFYKEMFTNHKRPAAALRAAQISISNQKRWRSPYYWAGFVLQGEWN